ncbi:hypothetical protein BCEN4_590036 [Burkholderia cenocepacia]|nr:hypothetical protein BCEN4_590036 [Burkholderia cenocepacia]
MRRTRQDMALALGSARHGLIAAGAAYGDCTSRLSQEAKGDGGLHLSAKQSRAHQETMDGFWAWALLSSFGDRVTVPA